jgi:Fic family protein
MDLWVRLTHLGPDVGKKNCYPCLDVRRKRRFLHLSALTALQQAAELIPNQDVLINSINSIPLREAKDSSAIENVVTTNDKLFRFANVNAEAADPATKETLRYRTALLEGYQEIRERPLTTRTATAICRVITGIDIDIRRTPVRRCRSHIACVGEIATSRPMTGWRGIA